MQTHTPDEHLFERYRSGETAALRLLIDRHHDDLMRFLLRLTGDRQAAEDAFQEAFLQIHIAADTFDASRRFRPWLFTIAANKARDILRRKGRRRTVELSAPVGGAAAGGGSGGGEVSFVDLMEIDIPAPDAAQDRRERDHQVQRVVDGMPEALREILLLAYFQRLSYAQIAEELGIPLGTVKSRLHAAVAAFAKGWQRAQANGAPD